VKWRRRRFTNDESYSVWCEMRTSKIFLHLHDVVGLHQKSATSVFADVSSVLSVFFVVITTTVAYGSATYRNSFVRIFDALLHLGWGSGLIFDLRIK